MPKEDFLRQSLILLKPDTVMRGICGEIISRIERAGLKIVALKMIQTDRERALKHYTEDITKRRGQKVRDQLVEMLLKDPVVAMVVEGIDAVVIMRKLCGATESATAAAGTIRGDYSHTSFKFCDDKDVAMFNIVHASANDEEAKYEVGVWFGDDEIVKYKSAAEYYKQ